MKQLFFILALTTTIASCYKEPPPPPTEDEEWTAYDKKYIIGTYNIRSHDAEYYDGRGEYLYNPGYQQFRTWETPCSGTIRFTADSFFIDNASANIHYNFPQRGKWTHSRSHPLTMYLDSYDNDGNDESIPSDTSVAITQGWGAGIEINAIHLSLKVANRLAAPPGKMPYTIFKQLISFRR